MAMINKIPKTIEKAEKSRYLILTSWFTMRENGKADAIRLMPFSIVKGTVAGLFSAGFYK